MQVPAPFEYERASSVDEAIALLERHGEDARLIAGYAFLNGWPETPPTAPPFG